jgi:hypothetical protein
MRQKTTILSGAIAGLVGLALFGLVGRATAAEVLDAWGLGHEMELNEALRVHVDHAGRPDLAQRMRVHSDLPWDNYIVRLIYLDRGTEIAFSRAFLLGYPEGGSAWHPSDWRQVGLLRYRRPLTDELAAQTRDYLGSAGPMPSAYVDPMSTESTSGESTSGLGPVDRAEAAARRAEAAAEMTERGAMAAEQAAAKLESTTVRAEDHFKKNLRK